MNAEFFSKYHRAIALVCITLALIILAGLLGILYKLSQPLPVAIDKTVGEASIHFASDRDRVTFPGQCVNLSWNVDHIKEVYLNGKATVGSGQQAFCAGSTTLSILDVVLADGTRADYSITIKIVFFNQIEWFAVLLIPIFGLVLAIAYLLQPTWTARIMSVQASRANRLRHNEPVMQTVLLVWMAVFLFLYWVYLGSPWLGSLIAWGQQILRSITLAS